MKTFHPLQRPGNLRTFTALLVATVMLATPLVPAATGAARFTPALAPATTVVSATKAASFPDPDGDNKAEPGETITYDVNVSNTGAADATGVTFTDTIDSNTTLVSGSLRVSPLAFADSYNATINTPLSISGPGVLANDTGTPLPTAVAASGSTSQGGTYSLSSDGSFSYSPPNATFQGADTFNYTATNGLSPDDSATVTINVDDGPVVTATSPVNGANNVAQNSNITVTFSESVNATTGSFSIECPTGSPQSFTLSASPSATFTLNPDADLPAGTTCTVKVFAAGITDADTFDPPDNMAADYTFSFGVKPLAVDDMRSATGNVKIDTATTGYSVLANDQAPGATITAFDATSAQGGQVVVNTSTGTFSYNPPRSFTGTDSFNYTITNGGGSDTGTVVLTVTDTVWFINNAAGACPSGCDGRLTNPYTSIAAFVADNGGGGADPAAGDSIFVYGLDGNYTGPLTLQNNQIVVGQGAASSFTALTLITPAPDSVGFPSTGGTSPIITTTVTSGQPGVGLAQGNHIHGLSFSNTDGPAVTGTSNVGTFTMSEIVVNNTNGANGIVFTGGGTVTSTGVNTISTASGTALNVTNTTIGAGGLNFRSISAGTGASTSGTGVILDNTGSGGGLTVSGNGAAGTGGTIRNKSGADVNTQNGDGTANITGTTGVGIFLRSTKSPSFSWMQLNDFSNYAILGSGVNGLALANVVVNGVNGSNPAVGEAAVRLDNLTGSASVTSSTVQGGISDNFHVVNTSGTLDRITFDGLTEASMDTATGNDAVFLQARNTATLKATVKNSSLTSARGDILQLDLTDTATGELIFQDNAVNNTHPAIAVGGGGVVLSGGGSTAAAPTLTYDIQGNTFRGARGDALLIIAQVGNGSFTGRVENNTFGVSGVDKSCSSEGTCVDIRTVGRASQTVLIDNNVIRQYSSNGVLLQFGDQSVAGTTGTIGSLNATVTNNTIDQPSTAAATKTGVQLNHGTTAGDSYSSCVDILNNNAPNSGSTDSGAGTDYLVRQRQNTTVALPGYTGAANSTASVIAYVQGRNIGTETVNATVQNVGSGGGGFINTTPAGSQCLQPVNLVSMASPVEPSGSAEVAANAPQAGAVSGALPSLGKVRDGFANAERPQALTFGSVTGGTQPEPLKAAPAAAPVPFSGETVTHNVGTLRAGKTVHIQFQVTVNDPFTGSPEQVTNTGTVSGDNFATASTNTTVVPILTPPSISIKDATVAEPASGTATAAFAVTLSHSYTHTVTVDFATAPDTGGANPATAGSDYTSTSGTLTFNPGQTVQTVPVSVLADADGSETAETFLVNLSNNSANSSIADGQAVGTITPVSTPGTVIISELRTSGPAGADDDFVELLNNTDSPVTVAAADASGGWALVKSGATCGDTPVVIAVIPNGTVIPARGNYLLTGSAYSLGAYAAGDQSLVFNIEDDHNVALFNTADLSNISTAGRLDAVGFGSNTGFNCDLLREGATLASASGSTADYSFVRSVDKGATADTNDNAADFIVVSTTTGAVGANTPKLGAPGPENSTGARGPVPCNVADTARFGRTRLDAAAALGSAPNTVRDATVVPNGANGTIDFRRTFTNNTGGNVNQLRFRITNVKDTSTPGTADLRALSSSTIVVTTSGGPATVNGTTLEQPPVQLNGGQINSSLGVGSISLATPLLPGASVNVRLLFGVQTAGDYHLSMVVETATAGQIGQDVWELRGNTENGTSNEGGCNTPPVASAGADQTIECGGGLTPVTLDGTASTDADGDTLTYEWREGANPLGTGATLNTSLSFGSHTVTLKVTDPSGDFSEDTVTVNIVDTTAPLIDAPANVTRNTGPGATSCGVFISDADLGTATASDGCSASVTVTRTGVPSGNNFPVGTTIITYTADDGHGHTASDQQVVTVNDNTPPTITAPANIVVNAPLNSCSANVDPGTPTVGDNCPGVTYAGVRSDAQALNAPYPVGTTTITWTATDAHSNTASAVQTVTVKDVTPPVITLTTGTINLSPPNHQYETFSVSAFVASASDGCDASVDINDVVISQATSDEPENASGNGDGNTLNDIVIAPDCKSLQLRAERDGGGDGRVYTITLKVKDSSGNVATAVRKVFVPKTGPAVDSGVNYTVGGCNP